MADIINDIRVVNFYKIVDDPEGGSEPVKMYLQQFQVKKNGSEEWESVEVVELPWRE